jgi:hypothetical protein
VTQSRSLLRRHPWWLTAIAAALVSLALLLAIGSITPFRSNAARLALMSSLGKQLDAEVELADLRFRVLPRLHVEGRDLVIRHHGRRDVPPLISVKRFVAEGALLDLLKRHVDTVRLEQLDIEIPPDRNRDRDATETADAPEGVSAAPRDVQTASGSAPRDSHGSFRDVARTMVIDRLISVDGRLTILPGEPDKPPRVWQLHDLRMSGVALDHAMPFEATLTNAIPPGEILTSGSFGPWVADEPRVTPLDGQFIFDRADLSVFKGISGILSARGSYGGTLARIDINGQTETPDFTVATGNHPMALSTTYHAIVDGTNGNTMLERIEASFLHTQLIATGGVVGKPGVEGRTVSLQVAIDRGRLEDVLKLAVKTPAAPMIGALTLRTSFVLPPGPADVVKKLELDGTFAIERARFADAEIQQKIEALSQRTRGEPAAEHTERVSSHFAGRFSLGHGQLRIPDVSFDVPGSLVQLSGTYGLTSEQVDFSGTAYTDAKVSEMTTGFKRWLLKPVEFFLFKRNDGEKGAAIPITISGPRTAPNFGVDKGRLFKRN